MEEIQLPKLKKLFIKIGNIENDNEFKCTLCNNWSGKNKASLGAHIRNCKFNPKNKDLSSQVDPIIVENVDLQFPSLENKIDIPEVIENTVKEKLVRKSKSQK